MFPRHLTQHLKLPAIGAPMFRVSGPELVIAQCRAGIIGAFPALNARSTAELRQWIDTVRSGCADSGTDAAAPFAVNLIVNKSNLRLDEDVETLCEARVPVVITSLGARADICARLQAAGSFVLHDVTGTMHARKALEKGVNGLIAVCAGAGGHGGTLSPFALAAEIRSFWQGPLALGGAVNSGRAVRALRCLGVDLAYIGTAFIAAEEAMSGEDYRAELLAADAAAITYTPLFSGVPANYLSASISKAGLDPHNLPTVAAGATSVIGDKSDLPKAWKEVRGAGQGVGATRKIQPAAEIIAGFVEDYSHSMEEL